MYFDFATQFEKSTKKNFVKRKMNKSSSVSKVYEKKYFEKKKTQNKKYEFSCSLRCVTELKKHLRKLWKRQRRHSLSKNDDKCS